MSTAVPYLHILTIVLIYAQDSTQNDADVKGLKVSDFNPDLCEINLEINCV